MRGRDGSWSRRGRAEQLWRKQLRGPSRRAPPPPQKRRCPVVGTTSAVPGGVPCAEAGRRVRSWSPPGARVVGSRLPRRSVGAPSWALLLLCWGRFHVLKRGGRLQVGARRGPVSSGPASPAEASVFCRGHYFRCAGRGPFERAVCEKEAEWSTVGPGVQQRGSSVERLRWTVR